MKNNKWIFYLLLIVLIVPARVVGIDQFATYDEPWWIIAGADFYYALTHHDFANTVYDYHPAVTTTWVVTAGMVSYFPQYPGFGQKYFDVRKPAFENFMREHGKDALPLVRNSRLIQIALITFLALLSFFLLQKLIDEKVAFLAIVLAMDAPFFFGNSRLINHEGMLAMFALVTLLSMQVYLNQDRKLIYLLISGAGFGLAQLTKSSSIVLLPLIGLLLFVELFKRGAETWTTKIWNAIKTFLIWFAAAALIYILLWPGMWVAPGKMFFNVYGNAFSYAFEGARLDVTDKLQPTSFSVVTKLDGTLQYLNSWLTTSTLVTWLGLLLIPFAFTAKEKSPLRSTITYLLTLAALFILLFGIARGRDAAHYILSSFVALDIIAGIGWGYALLWAQKNWMVVNRVYVFPIVVLLLTAFQLGSALPYYPYYYTYKNPFMSAGGVHGYGEGLDQAADYLAQQPNAQNLRVISYAARGCFSYFFPGQSDLLKFGFASDGKPYIEQIQNADYLVLYTIRETSRPDDAKLLRFLENIPPERTIFIDGIEYIRIYKVADFPKDVYDALAKQ